MKFPSKIFSWQLYRGKPRFKVYNAKNTYEHEKTMRVMFHEQRYPKVIVSTVILLFVNTEEEGPLYETMVFGGHMDGYTIRARSIEQAKKNHMMALKMTGINK